MIQRYRAWEKAGKRMVLVGSVDFRNEFIEYTYSPYDDSNRVVSEFLEFCDVALMQSTGLFDKNGKEIFENDIVKCYTVTEEGECEYVGVVCFKDFSFVIVDEKDTYDPLWNYKSGFVDIETEIEIIDNIYQNPELLEVE